MTADSTAGLWRLTRFGKEFGWVLFGQILAGVGGLAGIKWLTRDMSQAAYGEFSLALTGAILAQQCLGGPLGQAAMRYYSPCQEHGQSRIYFKGLAALAAKGSGALALVALLLCAGAWYTGRQRWTSLIVLALLFSLLSTYNILFDAIQSGSRNRAVVALHQAATQWSRPFVAVLFFAVAGVSLTSALSGYSLATLLVICSQLTFLVYQSKSQRSPDQFGTTQREIERKLSAYAIPFASWGALSWAQMASDRWFLELFHDAKAVGAYTVCYQLGYYPMTLLTTALSNLVAPILFEIAGSGEDGDRLKAAGSANRLHVWALLALTISVTVASAFLHKTLFRWFTAPAYDPYSVYLPVLALAAGIFAVAQAESLICLIRADSSALTGVKIIPALAGLVFNFVGAYWFGVRGAVGATLLFSLVYLLAVLRVTRDAKFNGEAGVTELEADLVKA